MSKSFLNRLEERICNYLFGRDPELEFEFPDCFDKLSTLEKSVYYHQMARTESKPKLEVRPLFPEIYDNIDSKNKPKTLRLIKKNDERDY